MKLTKNLGMLLLGVWLIVHGLEPLINLSFSGLDTIMGIVAIVAIGLILARRSAEQQLSNRLYLDPSPAPSRLCAVRQAAWAYESTPFRNRLGRARGARH